MSARGGEKGPPLAAGLLAALLVCAPAGAQAGERYWYLGGGVGYANASTELSDLAPVPVPCAPRDCESSIDDDALSAGLFAGFQYNENAAVEMGFVSLPDTYTLRVTDPNFPQPARLDVDQDSRAVALRGVFTLPWRQLTSSPAMAAISMSAVAGVTYWETESEFEVNTTGALGGSSLRTESKQTGFDLTFGARLNYDLDRNVRLSGAWDHYRELGDSSVAAPSTVPPLEVRSVRSPVNVFSLNMSYRFR
jgi:hypothetical protein